MGRRSYQDGAPLSGQQPAVAGDLTFYYPLITLMMSSKHILKGPEAFKLRLSHFMALTTLSLPRKVIGYGRPRAKEQCGSAHQRAALCRGTWEDGGRSWAMK